METTEKIVEAYVRYIKGWFTIPNIKCGQQVEIDLLAVDLKNKTEIQRYHIESGVSISQGFSLLTNDPYSPDELKKRLKTAKQRRVAHSSARCIHRVSGPGKRRRLTV